MIIIESGVSFWGWFWDYVFYSLILVGIIVVLGVVIVLFMVYGVCFNLNWGMGVLICIAVMGYVIFGLVIVVGILIFIGIIDNVIDSFMCLMFGILIGLLLSGIMIVLVFVYLVRFMVVVFGVVELSLVKIKLSLDDVFWSLGYGVIKILIKVYVLMMWGGLLMGVMLIFVDVMKELLVIMVICLFNFDILVIRVYNLVVDERFFEVVGLVLVIVLVGIILVIILSLKIVKFC